MENVEGVSFSHMQDCRKLPCMVTVIDQVLWGQQRFPRGKDNGQSYFLLENSISEKKKCLFSALDEVDIHIYVL